MSTVRTDYLILPAADYPNANPLPDLGGHRSQADGMPEPRKLPVYEEDPERLSPGDGGVWGSLPYEMLDDYGRTKRMRGIPSIVLENDHLRAEIVPRLGGKLWSLLDKDSGNELLSRNPVFQPANLAMLNAWASGGIEYNCGIIGHTPFTVSPLYAEIVEDDKRGPVVRVYEYERIRRAVYQIDFYLPDDSRFLFARVKIVNCSGHDIPMYWWSNIAVEQRESTRIIAPTESYIGYDDQMHLCLTEYPDAEMAKQGVDSTYPARIKRSKEYFFYIPDERRHYEAAVDADGTGFIQTSTARQKGRKMFLWGTHTGGKRWQEYLAAKGTAYIEIQAGLGRSQMEYVRMPAGVTFEWTEAYGRFVGDPEKIHGSWKEAQTEVETRLAEMIDEKWLEAELADTKELSCRKGRQIFAGSPWGAIERMRRRADGEEDLPSYLTFDPGKLTGTPGALAALLETGVFPEGDLAGQGFTTDPEWLLRLRACAQTDAGKKNPALFEILGVAEYGNFFVKEAAEAWKTALEISRAAGKKPGLLALYGDAWMKAEYCAENKGKTFELFAEACRACPDVLPLAQETGRRAIHEGREKEFAALAECFSEKVRANGRIKLQLAECHTAVGMYDEAKKELVESAENADIREGETLLGELWYRIHEGILRREEGLPEAEWVSVSEGAKQKGSAALQGRGENKEDDEIRARVKEKYPLPAELDFTMKN